MADNEMLVDVDIPVDIEGAYDPDGLPKVVPAAKQAAAAPTVKPEQLDAMRRERDTERAARTKAEQVALAATEAARVTSGKLQDTTLQAYGAHYARVNGELQQISSAIASTEALANGAERELIAAERDLAAATEPTEREAIAARKVKAQRDLTRAETELVTLQSGKYQAEGAAADAKRYWEAAATQAQRAPVEEPKPKEEPATPKPLTQDEWIDTCPPATRPWLRENAAWRDDPKLYRKILRYADEYADENGGQSALDSQDFVAALNEKFSPKANEVAEEPEPAAEPVRTRSAPAAPVSRASGGGAGNGAGAGGSKIRLSADEQTTALAMYPDMERPAALKKYATNKARAIQDGLYAPRG